MYQESRELVLKAPKCPLQVTSLYSWFKIDVVLLIFTCCALPNKVRLSFHLAHKSDDEVSVLEFHRQLRDVAEDQLSLAAVHYLRAHYQEAIDIYKRLVLQNKELMALHVCKYKQF